VRRATARGAWLLAILVVASLLGLAPLALATGPPDPVRIRVPAEKVLQWFPPGTELRGLAAEQLEALLAAAREGFARQSALARPRLLRASHFARWDRAAGLLTGSSELVVESTDAAPRELVLSPWTPAVVADPAAAAVVAREDGQLAVSVEAGGQTPLLIRWQLRARPSARGRGFSLALPASDVSALVLDLPAGTIPDGPPGIREGPIAGSEPGRVTWQFDGPGGAFDLKLRDSVHGDDPLREFPIWVSGPTRIELQEGTANWTTEWTVDAPLHGPKTLALELGAGLELIDVTGEAVADYHAEAADGATRLTVRIEDGAHMPATVSIRAIARVPAEGGWTVPAARPLDALWTGGTTSVRLGAGRLLEECHERAGRRLAPPPGETDDSRLLVFEASEPLPVAELVFQQPVTEVSAEVRGKLLLGASAPRLESHVTWRVQRGHLLELQVDLPPSWVPQRVLVPGVDEPLDWHPELGPGGGVRVHVVPPAGLPDRSPLVLTLEATATVPGGQGPIALPRVVPRGARIADELWVAWTEPGLTLRPTSAHGLAWIDPRLVTGAPPTPAPAPWAETAPEGLRGSLAWRWIAPQAEALVERLRIDTEPSGTVNLRARVDRARVVHDAQIVFQVEDHALSTLPIATSGPWPNQGVWRFEDEATGLELHAWPQGAQEQRALGLPAAGAGWELHLPHARRGRVAVRARLEQPWRGRGALPLLVLPERFHTRGTVVIEVERSVRCAVTGEGLRALDPSMAAPAPWSDDDVAADPLAYRPAHAFGYSAAGAALELSTEILETLATAAVIREAVLTTTLNPHGPSRQHLILRIASDRTQRLELELPPRSTLTCVLRDGLPLVPTRESKGISIPLITPRAARSFTTVALDYLTPEGSDAAGTVVHPRVPSASLPCLSFCWELTAPEPWTVTACSPEMLATDPTAPASSGRFSIGGAWHTSWRALARVAGRRRAEPPEAPLLRALDRLVVDTRPDEVTLGEWFTRWDSGPAPIVIDRLALAAAGWGPRSRVVPDRFPAPGAGAAEAALRVLGLKVIVTGGTALITSPDGIPDDRSNPTGSEVVREEAVHQAVVWGYDRSDRFQSVWRWRGEATPKVSIRGDSVESEPLRVREGWRTWRLAGPGWPGPDASVNLVDADRGVLEAWAAGLALVISGIVLRRAASRVRGPTLVLLAAAATLALAIGPSWLVPAAGGALAGLFAVALFWLGRALPGRSRGRGREPHAPSSVRRFNQGVTATLLLAAATGALASSLASRPALAQRGGDEPLIVLFPYEGSPDPDRRPGRGLLRREDVERLEALAATGRGPATPGVRTLTAAHRVYRRGERDIAVESDYLVACDPAPGAAWSFPVEDSSTITATLDGQPVPVQIQPAGRTATVDLGDPGTGQAPSLTRRRLRLNRIAGLHRDASEDVLRLAVNPAAFATVTVEDLLPGRSKVDVPTARGPIAARPGGAGITGLLGPADRIEVRWFDRSEPGPGLAARAGGFESLLLWDARPAGDHVLARLTCMGNNSTPAIRLGLDRGVIVRAGDLAGLVDSHWQGSDDRREWVASFDPPLSAGATVALEFWRPAAPGETEKRVLPRIEPLGVERYSGALAFRRPPTWSGRLWPGAGQEPMTDEAFVKAWGTLPDEPLTLAGTIRFSGTPAMSIVTGPPAPELAVDAAVQLAIESGRITLSLEAELTTVSGRSDQVEIALPPGLEVVLVEASGLGDWSRPARDRLVLRFTDPVLQRRTLRIQAWLPVLSDPLATGTANPEIDVPWLRWLDADVRSGQLTIVSPTRFQLLQSGGATALSSAPGGAAAAPDAGSGYRAVYRVDNPEALGRLTWDVDPPRLGVLVLSQLTVLPDVAEWVAVLRYDVAGGAAEAVHLRLPTAWAAAAQIQVVGDDHMLVSETRGTNTFWTIRPDHPIWGSQRLIVRSAIALPRTTALVFPDISPLGRGAVDTYLALVNASGRELVKEGSPGLQPIADEGRFAAPEFAGPSGASPSLYHVRRDVWSLQVHGGGGPRPIGPAPEEARVSFAEVAFTLQGDGAATGLAIYEVAPRSGPFLALDPPRESQPLWAAVNITPAPILRAPSGQWLIAIAAADESAGLSQVPLQVRLLWTTKAAAAASEDRGARPLALPALAQPNVPTFVTTHTPATLELKSPNGSFEPVPRERLEIMRLESLGHRIKDSLGTLDRGSQRESEALVSALVQFELLARDARRSALWNASSPLAYRDVRIARLDERVKIARDSLRESLSSAALDEFAESARIHAGLVSDDPASSTLEIPEPNTNVRLRNLGRPRLFQGESSSKDRPPILSATPAPQTPPWQSPLLWVLGLAGTVAGMLAAGFAAGVVSRMRWLCAPLLAAALAALGVAAGPMALAAGTLMASLGRWARSR
jgi:hypothetical protein